MAEEITNIFPIVLLRDRLMPNLFNEDIADITYWAGKSLAREFELHGIKAIIDFFNDAGFGTLTMHSQKATMQKWHLTGQVIETRLNEEKVPDFNLEAGFIAQQTQQQLGFGAEAQVEINKNIVILTVLTESAGTLQD
ncbi:YslB family protein [Weissella diestrammenae]|uniref:YslB family protein n=1 Tax=Weissella diestrammenae TaxID=1162633 RepID=A0A7G9T5U9_9LACO|nr:YslB family protein [Weissella diestrammenae]MCM0582304.1 YslB family protein [Weissella diestrammenae]QNN75474.1 YslB family protein [Weissella diestrammenae]